MRDFLNKCKKDSYFYIVSFTMIVLIASLELLSINFNELFKDCLLFVSVIFLLVHIYYSILSIKNVIPRVIISFIGVLIYLKTGNTNMSLILIVMSWWHNVEVQSLLKSLLFMKLLVFVGLILASVFDLIPFYINETSRGFRIGFGYIHPNCFALDAMYIVMLLNAIKFKIFDNRKKLFVSLLIVMFVLVFSKSRTASLLLVLYLVFIYKKDFFMKYLGKIRLSWILFPFVFSLVMCFIYFINVDDLLNPIVSSLNRLFSYRFSLGSRCFDHFSLSLLGGDLDRVLLSQYYEYSIVDNGYINLLFDGGLVPTFIIMYFIYKSIKYYVIDINSNYVYVLNIVMCLLIAISENIFTSLSFNITFVLIASYIEQIRFCKEGKL